MMKRNILLFLIIISIFILTPSRSQAQSANITINYNEVKTSAPDYYGSNIFWTDQDINLIKERMDKSNMNIMRLFVTPFFIENPNDNFDPNSINWNGFNFDFEVPWPDGKTSSYSTILEVLKNLDMYIMVDIPYLAPWLSKNSHLPSDMYSTYPANNLGEYEEFVYAVLYHMVNDAGISPEKIILEPFNEPDLGCGQDPSVHCFWKNHSMNDTVNTFMSAYNAAKDVSSDIRVVGMAECDNGRYVRNFIDNHNGLNYLDGITYHKYSNSYNISSLISMGTGFINDYGLPVFVNEYGERNFGSNGTDGALWNSYTLTHLLKNGIQPIQFPFSENPISQNPYKRMSLFYDWSNNWEIKDSFWVYSNFFRFMKETDILYSNESISDLDVIAGKKQGEVNMVITNRNSTAREVAINIQNLQEDYNNIDVYDNFKDDYIVESFGISGNSFEYTMPSRSSRTININAVISSSPSPSSSPNPDTITDILTVLTNWGNSGGEGDFYQDNKINGMDFGYLIKSWGF